MNSPVGPEIAEPLQEIDRVSLRGLVVAVNRVREALLGRMVCVMARLLFQVLPRRFLRVLLGRVLREAKNDGDGCRVGAKRWTAREQFPE